MFFMTTVSVSAILGRHMWRVLVFSLIFVASSTATITTSTSCYVDGTTASGPFSCNVTGSGFARASATVDSITTVFSGTSLSASLGAEASVIQSLPLLPDRTYGGTSLASATSDLLLALTTTGAQRPGFLKVTWESNGGPPYDGSADVQLVVGPWLPRDLILPENGFVSPLLSVELGQPFTFDMNVTEAAIAVFDDGVGSGFITASVKLQFYETDGTTLATIIESNPLATVPEPRFLGAFVIVCICLFGKHRRCTAIHASSL